MICAIFDTETTGLIKNTGLPLAKQPRVIEFFGVLVDDEDWSTHGELEFLCNPGFPLEPIITKITGLTDSDLVGKPDFKDCAADVAAFFSAAGEVVVHNLPFDQNMVDFEFRRIGDEPCPWPEVKTCTVQKTEFIKGHRLSLSNLHMQLFGEPFEGAHRAREDVMALLRCFRHLREGGDL